MPVFGNPFGLLALLGIPALLAIHFLQRKARELPVSTLFLLDHTRREAAGGRVFDRLIPSIPLWMQLLTVLILAWFLSEPRYQRSGSIQRIGIVMDSSASMGVFKTDAIQQIEDIIPELKAGASEVQIVVLEAAPNRPRIYSGSSLEEMKFALEKWQAMDGPVDPTQSLRLARSLVSREGTVLHVTDTPSGPLPFDALQLSVGEKVENVGFTGVSFSTEEGVLVWRAIVRNYSDSEVTRNWSIRTPQGSNEPREFRIKPKGLMTLQAAYPKDAERVVVTLSGDRFPWDDVMPLVVPKPKPLTIHTQVSSAYDAMTGKLMQALEVVEPAPDAATADLSLVIYNPLDPAIPTGNAMVFVEDETRTGAWLKGGIVAEAHPLIDGLNWQSLLARETIQLEQQATDTILLWQDKRPLIFLREKEGIRHLLFNFDPSLSNADKQPAFIVLLHRFAESIRAAKVAPVSLNLETGQPLDLTSAPDQPLEVKATDPEGKSMTSISTNHAMNKPGFLEISQGGKVLLNGAVHFGDPRESDLSACASKPLTNTASSASIERHTRPDPL
ncbi:MAG: BatA domain-containing protein, partial [Akkermansiaceae bacterium]|nr:BatA domain-containing protein [Akkermansiaceae bacterium]